MADFIQKIFMTKKQRALFNAVDSGHIQMTTMYSGNAYGTYLTTTYSIQTKLGIVQASYTKQNEQVMKPYNFYTTELVEQREYMGLFAKAMYKKLKHRYEQGKQRVR